MFFLHAQKQAQRLESPDVIEEVESDQSMRRGVPCHLPKIDGRGKCAESHCSPRRRNDEESSSDGGSEILATHADRAPTCISRRSR